MISLFRSRNGLRYYLFRGIGLSILLVLGIFGEGAWQVYHIGSQPLPGHVRADVVLVLGAAAWDKRPSPIFRERINHAITLYQSHRVEKIVFTGGTPKKDYKIGKHTSELQSRMYLVCRLLLEKKKYN